MDIQKGQRVKLSDVVSDTKSFQVEVSISGITVDMACFGLDNQQKLSNDAYMTFFNQPKTPCNGVMVSFTTNTATFLCDLTKLPSTIETLSFTAAIDGSQAMNQMQSGYLKFLTNGEEVALFNFSGSDFNNEKALMLGDIYRKNGEWRFNAVGQGFNGGLDSLLKHFGGEEDTLPHVSSVQTVQLTKALSLEKKLEKEAPQLLSLAKKLSITLDKKQLHDTVANVVIVMDASGSMYGSYQNGLVQSVLDRIALIAARLDEDGNLETWFYAEKCVRLTDICVENVSGYLHQQAVYPAAGMFSKASTLTGNVFQKIAGDWRLVSDWVAKVGNNWNNELPVMQSIVSAHKSSNLPTLVIFITDGDIKKNI